MRGNLYCKGIITALACTFTPIYSGLAQSVVVDGTTSTSVSTSITGVVNVDIAPANSASTSVNRYSDFSVDLPGVNLNNATVGARTIVNEVTSSRISNINGPLSVVGPQADVIIANPNGIVVNGGSFRNTGNVGLVTGNISIDGAGRANAQVRDGQIIVGSGGLSGTIKELDLIAKTIEINGNINGGVSGSIDQLNLAAGDSNVLFDPDRAFPDILPWAAASNAGGSNQDAVSVDITRASSLASGAIRITVTDAGAGVRMSGSAASSAGGFRLTANGRLEMIGAEITASNSIDVNVGKIALVSDSRQTTLLSQNSGIVLESTSGDIDLGDSRLEGQIVASSNLSSTGGITLVSEGGITQSSKGSGRQASVVSNEDGVAFFANDAISLDGVEVISNEDFIASTSGSIDLQQTTIDTNGSIRLLSSGDFAAYSSQLNADGNITLNAASALFDQDVDALENTRTELVTTSGGLLIETTVGDFLNRGSLLRGADTANGELQSDGAVTIRSSGDIINQSLDIDHLAVLFGDMDALSLFSDGSVLNDNGRLFSNSDLRIDVAHDLANETRLEGTANGLSFSSDRGGLLPEAFFLKRSKTVTFTGNFGDLDIDDELGLILAIGDLSVSADNIYNLAGDISGANITLEAESNVANQAKLVGSVNFVQKCRFFCSSSGSSNVQALGGTINAANDLDVSAGEEILSQAGSFIATNNSAFTAPVIRSTQLQVPIIVERPSGLTGFFRGRRGYLANLFTGSQFLALGGNLTFDGDVVFEGATLFSGGEQITTGNQDISQSSEEATIFSRQDLGLLGELF